MLSALFYSLTYLYMLSALFYSLTYLYMLSALFYSQLIVKIVGSERILSGIK